MATSFAWMRHEHLFVVQGTTTVMSDRFAFAAPLGPLGSVVSHLVLHRDLHSTLVVRAAHVKTVAERAVG